MANGQSDEELTLFQFESTDQDAVTITVVNRSDIGLYVDAEDGWKVKAGPGQQNWNKFQIVGFTPQQLQQKQHLWKY